MLWPMDRGCSRGRRGDRPSIIIHVNVGARRAHPLVPHSHYACLPKHRRHISVALMPSVRSTHRQTEELTMERERRNEV